MNRDGELPAQMRAAVINERGPAENIHVCELPTPEPGPTDVLARVSAVAVNPVDTYVRSGAFSTPMAFPFVVGRDLVGTVAATGPGAAGFGIGQWVWCNSMGHGGRQGAAAEFVAVPAERCYPLPDGAGPDAAAAVAHPAATAYLALHIHAGLQPGETVFVAGGAGHVGAAATALATRAGAVVIASASAGDLEYCRSLGAEVALDYRDPNFGAQLRDAAPQGVHVHLDTSGHHDLDLATEVLAPRGRIVLMAGRGARHQLASGAFYSRGGSIVGFTISNARIDELADAAGRINQLLAVRALPPRSVETLPLEDTAEAHRRLENGHARGTRLLLRP